MMSRVARLGCLFVALASCESEAPVEPAPLGEVCGAQEPFRVLAHAEDQALWRPWPLRVGDRLLYVLVTRQLDASGQASYGGPTVWATGLCGESPVRVATGVRRIFTFEPWPDIPFGCDEATGDIVALDPAGVAAPHVVFPDVGGKFGCDYSATPHGVVRTAAHDDEFGALLLYPYPEDPRVETAIPKVLLDPIRITQSGIVGFAHDVLASFDDFALAITPDDALVRVELADGATSILQHGVAAIDTSRDGRYILWQLNISTPGDPGYPEGTVYLRDQSDSNDVPLAETSLKYSVFPTLFWIDEGILPLGLGYLNREPMRIFFLPGLDFVDVRADLWLLRRLEGDRWLTSTISGNFFDRHDLRTGEAKRLFPREGRIVQHDEDAVILLEVAACCDKDGTEEGPMWRVPLDGSSPLKLARRATVLNRLLEDGRIVTPVNIDGQGLSTLMLVDTDTLAESRIDDQVSASSVDVSRVADEGILSYSVTDGARSGVYLARLPPK